ncbi:M64 family metallopeptidase [Enterovibrio calviensis]|uniref:M64 family metallopeptidase n=1 Tax=Enterovibrio calviensis TaxID=91359 RepID=UPI00373663F7
MLKKSALMILACLMTNYHSAALAGMDEILSNKDDVAFNYPIGQLVLKIQAFIDSDGVIDFSGDVLSGLVGNDYNERTLPFYKAFLLNNKNINLNDITQLDTIIEDANSFHQHVDTLTGLEGAAYRFGLLNFNKAINTAILNNHSVIIEQLETSTANSDYLSLAALVSPVQQLTLAQAIINHNQDARAILGPQNQVYVDSYTSQMNNIMGYYSANLLSSSDGISFGHIKPELAPKSDSRVFVIRDDIYTFWNNVHPLSDVLLNAIGLYSGQSASYTLTQREAVDERLTAYVANNDVNFSFVNEPLNVSRHHAYYAQIEKNNPQPCTEIETFIKEGGDLYVYHDIADFVDSDYSAFEGTCLPRLVAQYYDINLSTRRDTYSRLHTINTITAPYTFTTASGVAPTIDSPALGNNYDGEVYDPSVMYQEKHAPIMTFVELLVSANINSELLAQRDLLIQAFDEKNPEKYYLALIGVNRILGGINYQDPSLVRDGNQILLSENVISYPLYEYSLDGGLTYQPMTENKIRIFNQTYRAGDIRIKIKSDYVALLGYGEGEVFFAEQIDYDPSIRPVIDFDKPVYTSADGDHKLYTGRTDGKGWDLVITGDGYLERDRALFDMHVKNAIEAFLSYENLVPHFAMYNIHSVFVASNDRGADWSVEEGCDPINYDNCLVAKYTPSPAAEHKNNKDTAFDAGFYNGGTFSEARALSVDNYRVRNTVAKVVPHYDMSMVMVNTNVYGGVGGMVPTSNKMNPHVFVHELGHSFGDLHDEYTYGGVRDPNFCDSNVCADFNKVPWRHFLPDNTTLDSVCKSTSAGCPVGTTGWYEGGYYQAKDMWRSTDISIMKENGYPFYAYNAERWANRLYAKTGYFSVIAPKHAALNQRFMTLHYPDQAEQVFAFNPSVEFYDEDGSEKRVQSFKWYINGVHQQALDNAKEIRYGEHEFSAYTVKLIAMDETGIIVKEEGTVSAFEWSVENNSAFSDNDVQATASNTTQLRAEIVIDRDGIRVEKVIPLEKEASLNTCSPQTFNGQTLQLVNDEDTLTFCAYNVGYSHKHSVLIAGGHEPENETYRFDVVLTEEMASQTYRLESHSPLHRATTVSPITVDFSQY